MWWCTNWAETMVISGTTYSLNECRSFFSEVSCCLTVLTEKRNWLFPGNFDRPTSLWTSKSAFVGKRIRAFTSPSRWFLAGHYFQMRLYASLLSAADCSGSIFRLENEPVETGWSSSRIRAFSFCRTWCNNLRGFKCFRSKEAHGFSSGKPTKTYRPLPSSFHAFPWQHNWQKQ